MSHEIGRLFVMAGNYGQFRGYLRARSESVDAKKAVYLSNLTMLIGADRPEVVVTGTKNREVDWFEFVDQVKAHNGRITFDPY